MYDAKPEIHALLSSIEGVTVSDAYPQDFAVLPCISFYEIANVDPLRTHDSPLSDISIQIDIWHNRSTGEIASTVDEKMNSVGFRRAFATDVPDPSGIKHKTMRYRGIVDTRNGFIYQRS